MGCTLSHRILSHRILSRRLALAALLAVVPLAARAQQEPIKVGGLFPMTGPAAAAGISMELGARMAIADINAAGGIMGRKVELVMADDQFDTTQSVSLAKKLAFSDKVAVILGPSASQQALAVEPVLREANLDFFTTGSPPKLNAENAPTGFSMQLPPEEQAVAVINWAVDVQHARKIALLHDNSPNSQAARARFAAWAAQRGVAVTGIEQFDQGNTDMTPQLLTLRRGAPDALLLTGATAPDMAHVLINVDELGWDVPIGGTNVISFLYAPIAKMAGKAISHVTATLGVKAFTYCQGEAEGGSAYAKYLARLRREAPGQVDKIPLANGIYMYDGMMAARAAMDATHSTDGRKMAAWLEQHSREVPNVAGEMHASPTQHFMADASTYTMIVDPTAIRADGTMRRAGC